MIRVVGSLLFAISISNQFIIRFLICRVPLHKTRSLRRVMSDNGMSLEELRALASSYAPPDGSPSPDVPVERLTNFMDVCVAQNHVNQKLPYRRISVSSTCLLRPSTTG